MRVLLSPRAAGSSPARAAAERLAAGGDVISLPERGAATLERRLTPAEVDLVRRAMTGVMVAGGVGIYCEALRPTVARPG